MNLEYKQKYLKYKKKYFNLKKQLGGASNLEQQIQVLEQQIQVLENRKNEELKNYKNQYEDELKKLKDKIDGDTKYNKVDKVNMFNAEKQQMEKVYKTETRNIKFKYNPQIKKLEKKIESEQQKQQQPQQPQQPQQQSQKEKNPGEETDIVKLGNTIRETKKQIAFFTKLQQNIQYEINIGNRKNVEKRRKINTEILPKLKEDLKFLTELEVNLRADWQKKIDHATNADKEKLQTEKEYITKVLAHQKELGNINLILANDSIEKEEKYMAKQKADADKKRAEQKNAYKIKHQTIAADEYKTHISKVDRCTDQTACEQQKLTFDCNPLNIFKCPISLCIMQEPVKAADGHLYEQKQIKSWFDHTQFKKTPMGSKIISSEVGPVRTDVQQAIKQWKEAHKSLSKMKRALAIATESSDLENLGEQIDLSLVKKLFNYDSGSFQTYYNASDHKKIINEPYIIGDHSEDEKRVILLEEDFKKTKENIQTKYNHLKEAEAKRKAEAEAKRKAAAEARRAARQRQKARSIQQNYSEHSDEWYRKKWAGELVRMDDVYKQNAERHAQWIQNQSYINERGWNTGVR